MDGAPQEVIDQDRKRSQDNSFRYNLRKKIGVFCFLGFRKFRPNTADIDFCPSVFADLIDSTPAVYAHAIT